MLKVGKRGFCLLGGAILAQWEGPGQLHMALPRRGGWGSTRTREGRGGNKRREASGQEGNFWGGKREWKSLVSICISCALGKTTSSRSPSSDAIFSKISLTLSTFMGYLDSLWGSWPKSLFLITGGCKLPRELVPRALKTAFHLQVI